MAKIENVPTVDLTKERETRTRLRAEFERLLSDLSAGGLSAHSPEDLNALAELLFGVTEQRKRLEREEKALKEELRRHFPKFSSALVLDGFIAVLDQRVRTDLDRTRLTEELGIEFVSRFTRTTEYETLVVKRNGGAA
jgi:hypothetical protein